MDTEAASLSAESIQALAEALKPMIREEVDKAVGAGSHGAGESATATAAARLEELLSRAEEKARGLAASLGTDAGVLGEEALGKGREAVDQAGQHVQDNPIAALLIALGFGFILGVIFGPGRR
jgi:ElaB/YqjD/DUF883 family membrane-anchored ribosome-binding protein